MRVQLLGTHHRTREFIQESLPEQRLEDHSFIGADHRLPIFAKSQQLAVPLEPAESLKEGFASVDRGLDVLHELLKTQMQGNRGVVKILRLGDRVLGGFDRDRARKRIPLAGPVVADLHRIFRTGLVDRYIPVPGLERDLDLALDQIPVPADAQECLPARMEGNINIPVGKQPVRFLGDQKNRIRPIRARQFAEVVHRRQSILDRVRDLGRFSRRRSTLFRDFRNAFAGSDFFHNANGLNRTCTHDKSYGEI